MGERRMLQFHLVGAHDPHSLEEVDVYRGWHIAGQTEAQAQGERDLSYVPSVSCRSPY
jgi:hypothetical protein